MKPASIKPLRCAIYTRVSTEHGLDQEFNWLDAQYDAASAYIKSQAHAGWALIRSRYDDGGYSGGSTHRPDLQRLLDDNAASPEQRHSLSENRSGSWLMEDLQQSVAKRPASRRKARSSLVRRLVQAQDDPAKQRIRRWLSKIDDERLLSFGLTLEDIALLRGSRSAGKFVSALLSVPSPPGLWF